MENSQFIQLNIADKLRKLNDSFKKDDKLADEVKMEDIFPGINIK